MKYFFVVSLPFVIYSLLNFISQLFHGTSGTTQNHGTWAIIVISVHLGWIAVALLIWKEDQQAVHARCES